MIIGQAGPKVLPVASSRAARSADDDLPQVLADTVTDLLGKPRARGWIHLCAAATAIVMSADVAHARSGSAGAGVGRDEQGGLVERHLGGRPLDARRYWTLKRRGARWAELLARSEGVRQLKIRTEGVDESELQVRSPLAYATSLKSPVRLYYSDEASVYFDLPTQRLVQVARARGLDVTATHVAGTHFTHVAPAMKQSIAFFKRSLGARSAMAATADGAWRTIRRFAPVSPVSRPTCSRRRSITRKKASRSRK